MPGLAGETWLGPEWAAWANGVAVRELDFHDTFLAADYSHPATTSRRCRRWRRPSRCDGAALVRGLAAGYEISNT